MPITISGSSGISGVDGSAATPALQGSDSNTGISFGTDEVNINTGGSTRATVDSSGRLLVGTATARTDLSGGTSGFLLEGTDNTHRKLAIISSTSNNSNAQLILGAQRSGTIGGNTIVGNNANLGIVQFMGSDGTGLVPAANIQSETDGTPAAGSMPGRLKFLTTASGSTSPTERMRITSTGDVYIGDFTGGNTSGSVLKAKGYNTRTGYNGSFGSSLFNLWWTGSALQAYVDVTNVGTFTFSSDYRIKQNIETINSSCIERVKQLRPVQYELADYGSLFQADGVVREGFIAHEVQEVIPSGAEGEKDEEDRVQNLRVDAIVAVLTKALQESVERIETLETANASQATTIAALDARLTALEGGANP